MAGEILASFGVIITGGFLEDGPQQSVGVIHGRSELCGSHVKITVKKESKVDEFKIDSLDVARHEKSVESISGEDRVML